ncbi:hypothetical protein M527_27225 [Sphingobium indicum IP26]|nr:hypothetical protein M527_27225 [Sphingobium indicum IP26]
MRLSGVRASFGELSVRVHAWKPKTESNISLVSGSRLLLQAGDEEDITLSVPFAAQKDVLYAFYGYLSEDSDVAAQELHVAIEESEDSEGLEPDPPRSILAIGRETEGAHSASSLLHAGRVVSDLPVSQSCTHEQIAALALSGHESDDALGQWSETLYLNALSAYGATHSGLDGLVVGPSSADFAERFVPLGLVVRQVNGPPPPRTSGDFFDFLLISDALHGVTDCRSRWEMMEAWLARLKIGGLAVLDLRYRPDSDLVSSSSASDAQVLTRNEIAQWALRLIGSGYSVAPLAFAPLSDLVMDERGLAGFVMIVQRL